MHAGYTGLPPEHREAYEAQMAAHERAYSRVREHALAGADSDFDEPLTTGEREHQRELRRREGMQQRDVQRVRNELRGSTPGGRRRAPAQRAGGGSRRQRRPAAAAGAKATQALRAATTSGGSTLTYLIGIGLFLSLFYLLVAGKGAGAVNGIVNVIVGAAGAFVKPIDPIAHLEQSLGATPVQPLQETRPAGSPASPYAPGAAGKPGEKAPPPSSITIPGQLPSGVGQPPSFSATGGKQAEKSFLGYVSKSLGWAAKPWEEVIEIESGWNPTATNPQTGAYGLGQLNPEDAANPLKPRPGSTAAQYPGYAGNYRAQILADAKYIQRTYGTPTNALAFHLAHGWY
jgi:hypothetical protein